MPVQLLAAAANIGSQLSGGLIRGSSQASEEATFNAWVGETQQGNQNSLNLLVTKAGLSGGFGIAANAVAKEYAKTQLQTLLNQGYITGPNPIPPGTPNLTYKIVTKATTNQTPTSTTPLQSKVSSAGLPTWAWVAVALGAGFLVFRYMKRAA